MAHRAIVFAPTSVASVDGEFRDDGSIFKGRACGIGCQHQSQRNGDDQKRFHRVERFNVKNQKRDQESRNALL